MASKKKNNKNQSSKRSNKRKKLLKENGSNKPKGVKTPSLDSNAPFQTNTESHVSEPINPAPRITNDRLITIIVGLLSLVVSVFDAYHQILAKGKFYATINGIEVKTPCVRNCLVYFDTDSVDLCSIDSLDIFPKIKNDSKLPLKDVDLKYTIRSEETNIDFTSDYSIDKYKEFKKAKNVDKTIYSNVNAPGPFEQFVMKDQGHATIDLEATYAGAKNPFSYHSEIYTRKICQQSFCIIDAMLFLNSKKSDDHKVDLYILNNDEISLVENIRDSLLLPDICVVDFSSYPLCPDSLFNNFDYHLCIDYEKLSDSSISFDFSIYDSIFDTSIVNHELFYNDSLSICNSQKEDVEPCTPKKKSIYKIVIGVVLASVVCIGLFVLNKRVVSKKRVKLIKGPHYIDLNNSINGVNNKKVKKVLPMPVVLTLSAIVLYFVLYFILEIFFETSGWFWQGLAVLCIALVLWPASRWIVNVLTKKRSERFPRLLIASLLWIVFVSAIILLLIFVF